LERQRTQRIRTVDTDSGCLPIGEEKPPKPQGWKWLLLLLAGIIVGTIIWKVWPSEPTSPIEDPEQGVFEPSNEVEEITTAKTPLAKAEETGQGDEGKTVVLRNHSTSCISYT